MLANNTIRGPILETKLLVEEEKEGFLVTHDGSGTRLVFQPSFPCLFLHFLPFFASLDRSLGSIFSRSCTQCNSRDEWLAVWAEGLARSLEILSELERKGILEV